MTDQTKQPESALMHAAIKLYLHLGDAELDSFMSAIGADSQGDIKPNPNSLHSSKVWHWGLRRWGCAFSFAEYEARENHDKLRLRS